MDVNKLMVLTCQHGADSCLAIIMAGKQDRGRYVNQGVGGVYGTPLKIASSNGRNTTVRRLVEDYGANVSGRGGYGTALCCAAGGGHLSTVRILIQLGAKPGECTSVDKYPGYSYLINPGNEHDEIKKYLAMLKN